MLTARQQAALVEKAAAEWASRGMFIRFVDGDVGNCAAANLVVVPLEHALLQHAHDWCVDWDAELTERERDALRADAELRARAFARYQALLREKASAVPADWRPQDDGVALTAVAEPGHKLAFVYSSARSGALRGTSLLAVNVEREAVPKVAKTMNFLHRRAAGGALVAAGQVVDGGADYEQVRLLMLVDVGAAGREALLAAAVHNQSPAFRAALGAGRARILLLVPLKAGEGGGAFEALRDVAADLAAHRSEGTNAFGTIAGGGRLRMIK